jgi:hypothetical protein
MSHEPSHRKPPRQERWPNATPGEGWPAYQQGDGSRAWKSAAAFAGTPDGYAAAGHGQAPSSNGYGDAWGGPSTTNNGHGDAWGGIRYSDPGPGYWAGGNGYGGPATAYPTVGGYADDGYTDGLDAAADGYAGGYADGYTGTAGGYGETRDYREADYREADYREADYRETDYRETDYRETDYRETDYREAGSGYYGYESWDGYAQPGYEFTGPGGHPAQDEYPGPDPAASSVLVAPDIMGEWERQADQGPDGDPGERGPMVGAVTGLLAAAVAIGVATFAAAFVRPQASPASVVAGVFIDHLPAALSNHLMAHFGAHGQTVLLVGAIGLTAMVFGCLARRNPSAGVAGIAAFGLLGAFVAITRPESRASDVIPWAIGGFAGILALLWLARASAPVASVGPAYSGGRRRSPR